MLEILRIISYMVWIGVGITAIASSIWGLYFYKKCWSGMFKEDSKEEE